MSSGKAPLDNFIDPASRCPVIATTSELMTTGVDAQTCNVIVLDQRIQSMTRFKQIIGRETRINEDYGPDGKLITESLDASVVVRGVFEDACRGCLY